MALATVMAVLSLVLGAAPTAAADVPSAPQGGWVGSYGGDGYVLGAWNGSSDLASLAGARVTADQAGRWVWDAGTTDPRALQSPGGSGRKAATYYDENQIRLRLDVTSAYNGSLHLYAVDWDNLGRRETITVDDGSGPRAVALNNDFTQGAWVNLPISVAAGGTVRITVDRTAGRNAVLSGIFLGGAGTPPQGSPPPGPAVPSAPQGGWVGSYGGDGYVLGAWNGSSDLASVAGARVTADQAGRYVWDASSSDPRALQSPGGAGRKAATYHDENQIRLRLDVTSAYNGSLHLYAVDWDNLGRRETITVDDGSGPRAVALNNDFTQGAWINLPINVAAGGTVRITVDRTGGRNAVLSGIFLGGAGPPPSSGNCVAQPSHVTPPSFPIGVWHQPSADFAKWRGRGVNTVVDDSLIDASFSAWQQALQCQDMFAIRPPQQALSQENSDPRLLALAQPDEPDLRHIAVSELRSNYGQWNLGAPSKPVFVNFSAANVYHQPDIVAGSRWVWDAHTNDTRALLRPDGASRTSATYYDSDRLLLTLRFQAAYRGDLHLYAVDWDTHERRETVTVDDGSGARSVALNSDFSQGAWVNVPINVGAGGAVRITVDRTAGVNAVLAGAFLGGPATASSQISTSPQGNWLGTYGADGYVLGAWNGSGDLASLPNGSVSLGQSRSGAYQDLMSAADWISEDIYPVSGYNRPDWVDLFQTADPPAGSVLDTLQQWSAGKPQYAFIEASDIYGSPYRGPTPDEFRGEIWDAVIHGARGVFYYVSGPRGDDSVSADVVAEMTSQDAALSKLGRLLAAPGARQSAPAPFEVATRTYCGTSYTVALNFSHQAATYQGTAYAPYQVRISPTPPDTPAC